MRAKDKKLNIKKNQTNKSETYPNSRKRKENKDPPSRDTHQTGHRKKRAQKEQEEQEEQDQNLPQRYNTYQRKHSKDTYLNT